MIDGQLRGVLGRIQAACQRAGRKFGDVELLLVTKEVEVARINEVYKLGLRNFGENRVQDLLGKQEALPKDIKWHLIGHLQTNKVKSVVGRVVLIHSCDRLDLAKELEKQAAKQNVIVDILIQVNTSGEETKFGFSPESAEAAIPEIVKLEHLKVRGLMTIGPNTEDESKIRESFKSLRLLKGEFSKLFPAVDWRYLSMGMSSDFEIAIEEGANLLRIGSAVFGPRPQKIK